MDHKWADYNHGLNLAHKQKMTVTGRKLPNAANEPKNKWALRRPKVNLGWKRPNGITGR